MRALPLLQDSLQEVAKLVAAVLPPDHAILHSLERLADRNMSSQARARYKAEEDLIKVTCLLYFGFLLPRKKAAMPTNFVHISLVYLNLQATEFLFE